ncbi:MAG: TIGR03915 family putative DNA repair protein [Acetobacteraceae bacterium]|nr:TIGR03915 family putative DNA repair protein [Acetobacteraceae bacterium]
MPDVVLPAPDDIQAWREAARRLLSAGVPPESVTWRLASDPAPLFASALPPPAAEAPRVPRRFLDLAGRALLHRDPARFGLCYALAWRLRREPRLLEVATDPLVARVCALAKAVRRDAHKMHAFLRFREAPDGRHIAWFEPAHHILRAEAPWFVRRFASLRFAILTPEASAAWDGQTLSFGPGARRADAPPEDAAAALWNAYYAAIFNPARLKPAAMRGEMPKRYWPNLPEASLIPRLIAEAEGRVARMLAEAGTPPRRARQRPGPRDAGSGAGRLDGPPLAPSSLGPSVPEGRPCASASSAAASAG